MKVDIKTKAEIDKMRVACRMSAEVRDLAAAAAVPGATTGDIDRVVREYCLKNKVAASFLGYAGFPGALCVSVNDEVIHGIPGKRVIRNGDIVSVDVGATFGGFVGDCAGTYPCGEVSDEAKRLIEVTRQSFFEGLKFARSGYRIDDIGSAIQEYVESRGYSVVRDYVGHGVGRNMHEAPEVPNYSIKGLRANPRLVPGMTIAIEPMINAGGYGVSVLDNGWTVVTNDGSLSAHYENTVLITDGEAEILTMAENID